MHLGSPRCGRTYVHCVHSDKGGPDLCCMCLRVYLSLCPPPGSMFVLSLFDKMWHPNLTEAEAVAMMEAGIHEVKTRLAIAPTNFIIKIIDANGIRTCKVL